MKTLNFVISILCIILLASSLYAQNHSPVVENVSASQRTDGSKIVDIYYDVYDEYGDTLTISMEISDDDGQNWNIIPTHTSGDIGQGILSGTNKHIIWNAGDESTVFEGSQFRFKIIADDGAQPQFEWCTVPAGEYTYGEYDEILTIDYDYQIMKYEVTNQKYVTYLEEAYATGDIWIEGGNVGYVVGYYGGDEHWPAGNYNFYNLGTQSSYNYAKISWDGDSFIINVPSGYNPGDFDDHPVVEVTWFGAWAFGEHYGIRLPTEHEWEKSARGNTGWDYPWGNSIDGSRANYWNSGDPFDIGTTPVGYYNGENHSGFQTTDSPSPYGAYDMAGNVLDLTDSFWSDTTSLRVIRGGGWGYEPYSLQSWFRYFYYPGDGYYGLGFRCCRALLR